MINYTKEIEEVYKRYRIDFTKDVFVGLGMALSMIEIAHGEESDCYKNEGDLIADIVEGFVDISWSDKNSYSEIPSEVAESLLKLFKDIDYFILSDEFVSPNDTNFDGIVIGSIPEGIAYEMSECSVSDKIINSIKCYKICEYRGEYVIIYSDNEEAVKILKIISSIE